MLDAKDAQKRLSAAYALLAEPTTTREKFNSVRAMIHGLNPGLDNAMWRVENHLSTWDKVQQGEVIHLTAENLPENTEEEKKRKKWALFLIVTWKDLQSEVQRVQAEMASMQTAPTAGGKVSGVGRILRKAKGPLGLVTLVAIGIAVMHQTAVNITIENKGCATMYPSGSIPISIPGLSLPSEPIKSGDTAVVTIPGFTVNVDGTTKGTLSLKVLTYALSFQLPDDIRDVKLDGASLLGEQTTVKLSEKDEHTLTLMCS